MAGNKDQTTPVLDGLVRKFGTMNCEVVFVVFAQFVEIGVFMHRPAGIVPALPGENLDFPFVFVGEGRPHIVLGRILWTRLNGPKPRIRAAATCPPSRKPRSRKRPMTA